MCGMRTDVGEVVVVIDTDAAARTIRSSKIDIHTRNVNARTHTEGGP